MSSNTPIANIGADNCLHYLSDFKIRIDFVAELFDTTVLCSLVGQNEPPKVMRSLDEHIFYNLGLHSSKNCGIRF